MTRKILLAGLVGGIVMYAWGIISHLILPLGMEGIKQIPNEEQVVTALRDDIKEPGFYFFPGEEHSPDMTKEQQKAAMQKWEEKIRQGPNGILIYTPEGKSPMSASQLIIELLSNIAGALVAAYLLSKAVGGITSFGVRVLFVALLGLFASLAIDISYWNWYGFPGSFTLAAIIDEVVGWGLVGLPLATMIKRQLV
ncbi:MAG: hypothetical protein WCE90_11020 [Candidatus Zixiibacteriota bacterium]